MNVDLNVSPTYSSREWENLLAKTFLPGSVDVEDAGSAGHINSQVRPNRLWLAQLTVRPQSIVHAALHLSALSTEERESVIAHVVVEGSGFVEQGGERLPFRDGDVSFRNLSEPSRVVFEVPGSFYAVRLPATVMQAHRGERRGRRNLAPRIAGGESLPVHTVQRLLSSMTSDVPAFYLSFALPWLFAAAYHGDETAAATEVRVGNEMRWQQVLNYIEQHLFDCDVLSPRACAQAVDVSESYLHRLFAQRGLRFSKIVLERRLDTAHALLQCGSYRSHTIASIAYQCGFKEAAHFSRLFKQRYGVSPRECRAGINARRVSFEDAD